ncbi:MAG TPA: DUF4936 family protein [Rubrivivax sp.]|nr:DUF4936 family protein [Rubrivivax sp.]
MTRELFVYWHVTGASAAAEAAARQMQDRLCVAHVGLVSRLYRKVDSGRCTLMETYALPGSGIDTALQQRIEAVAAQALAPWCAGGRHVEVFEDCR